MLIVNAHVWHRHNMVKSSLSWPHRQMSNQELMGNCRVRPAAWKAVFGRGVGGARSLSIAQYLSSVVVGVEGRWRIKLSCGVL